MTSQGDEKLCLVANANDNKSVSGSDGCHAADFTAIGLCGAFAYVSLMARLYSCICSVNKNKTSDMRTYGRLAGHTVIWDGKVASMTEFAADEWVWALSFDILPHMALVWY